MILLYGLYRAVKRRGGIRRLYHFNKKIIKRNPIPTVMLVIIFGMSFLLINMNVKIGKLKNAAVTPQVKIVREIDYVNCDSTGGVAANNGVGEISKKDDPMKPHTTMEKAIVPNIRRYTSDKLNEMIRGPESENG